MIPMIPEKYPGNTYGWFLGYASTGLTLDDWTASCKSKRSHSD